MNLLAREAAVINMMEMIAAEDFLDIIKTELWCIREGIATEEHPEIWDITLGAWSTSTIIMYVLEFGLRDKHDQAAFLLCTMSTIS